ncbi:MAG TPA: hypothetical protein VF122_03070 [Caulobacteraceae bacterium]
MTYPVFTKQEFMAGLDRLGLDDTRKLLRTGALDGDEKRWAEEWLTLRVTATLPPVGANAPEPQTAPEPRAQDQRPSFALAS